MTSEDTFFDSEIGFWRYASDDKPEIFWFGIECGLLRERRGKRLFYQATLEWIPDIDVDCVAFWLVRDKVQLYSILERADVSYNGKQYTQLYMKRA